MRELRAEIVFVDVDDTLVRSAGSKRIPITSVTERVAALKQAGATLYLLEHRRRGLRARSRPRTAVGALLRGVPAEAHDHARRSGSG